MGYSLSRFLRPLKDTDKTIKIYDDRNFPVHTINPFSILRLFVTNSNLNIALAGNRTIVLDFKSNDETKEALGKLQSIVDGLRQTAPEVINKETEKYIEKIIQVNSGVDSLNGSTASDQSLVVSGDSNLSMSIKTTGSTHSIGLSWTGLLPIKRGGLNNNNFNEKQLLISTSDSIISSGYTINDEGLSNSDIWTAGKIVSYYKSTTINKEKPSGEINGENYKFELSQDVLVDSEHVFLNGLLQDSGEDYKIEGRVIYFYFPPLPDSKIRVSYKCLNLLKKSDD